MNDHVISILHPFAHHPPKAYLMNEFVGIFREIEATEDDSYLHTDDSVDEEQHRYEETNVRQSLEEDGFLLSLSRQLIIAVEVDDE